MILEDHCYDLINEWILCKLSEEILSTQNGSVFYEDSIEDFATE